MQGDQASPKTRLRRSQIGLAGLGIELAAAMVGLTLLGLWIDRRYGSSPWGVVICAAIGFVGGMANFVRAALRAAERSARKDEPSDVAEDR